MLGLGSGWSRGSQRRVLERSVRLRSLGAVGLGLVLGLKGLKLCCFTAPFQFSPSQVTVRAVLAEAPCRTDVLRNHRVQALLGGALGDLVRLPKGLLRGIYRVP